MRAVERTVTVRAPVDIVFAAWANYQSFPAYIPHVGSVEKINKKRTRWTVDLLGYRIQFEAELDEVRPNRFISWHSVTNIKHLGSVNFAPAEEGGTRVTVRLLFDIKSLSPDLIEDLETSWKEFEDGLEEVLNSFKSYVEQMWWQVPSII